MVMNRAFDNLQSTSEPVMTTTTTTQRRRRQPRDSSADDYEQRSYDVFTSDDQIQDGGSRYIQNTNGGDVRYAWKDGGGGGDDYTSRRDGAAQTPGFQATQTPIRLQLDASGTRFQHGTISLGDTYVLDTDGRSFIQPWSQLRPVDSGETVGSRDFSTQTFGQARDFSNSHAAATQTNSSEFVSSRDFSEQTDLIKQRAVENDASSLPPAAVTSRDAASKQRDAGHSSTDDIFSQAASRRSKQRARAANRSKSRDRDSSQAATMATGAPASTSSRKDILRYMLMQVRSLRTELDPDGAFVAAAQSSTSAYAAKKKKKHKKQRQLPVPPQQLRSLPLDVTSAAAAGRLGGDVNDVDDDVIEREYTRRRLALLYHTPQRAIKAESRSPPPPRRMRARSVESYHSDDVTSRYSRASDDFEDSYDRNGPRRRGRARSRSRDRSLYRYRRDDDYPRRRAVTPPSDWRSMSERDVTPPPPPSSMRRPRLRRRLPPAPSEQQYPAYQYQYPVRQGRVLPQPPPPPPYLGAAPLQRPLLQYANQQVLPAPAPHHSVTFAPMPPQVFPLQPYNSPQTAAFQSQNPQTSSFQPQNPQTTAFQPQNPQAPTFRPQNPQTAQPSTEPRYVVLKRPATKSSLRSGSRGNARSRRDPAADGDDMEASLQRANSAIDEMKELTRRMAQQAGSRREPA